MYVCNGWWLSANWWSNPFLLDSNLCVICYDKEETLAHLDFSNFAIFSLLTIEGSGRGETEGRRMFTPPLHQSSASRRRRRPQQFLIWRNSSNSQSVIWGSCCGREVIKSNQGPRIHFLTMILPASRSTTNVSSCLRHINQPPHPPTFGKDFPKNIARIANAVQCHN